MHVSPESKDRLPSLDKIDLLHVVTYMVVENLRAGVIFTGWEHIFRGNHFDFERNDPNES